MFNVSSSVPTDKSMTSIERFPKLDLLFINCLVIWRKYWSYCKSLISNYNQDLTQLGHRVLPCGTPNICGNFIKPMTFSSCIRRIGYSIQYSFIILGTLYKAMYIPVVTNGYNNICSRNPLEKGYFYNALIVFLIKELNCGLLLLDGGYEKWTLNVSILYHLLLIL